MPELSKDIVSLVAWVFYGLTSNKKPLQFERIVQALIFTLAVRVLVFVEYTVLEYLGNWIVLRPWDSDADLTCSFLSAIALGLMIALTSNTDRFYKILRDNGLSSRSAHPSEWYGTLSELPRYVVLHLKDERRLYGWPKTWPSDPKNGHFFIITPSWIDEGNDNPLESTEGLLINVVDVKWVEFLKEPEGM